MKTTVQNTEHDEDTMTQTARQRPAHQGQARKHTLVRRLARGLGLGESRLRAAIMLLASLGVAVAGVVGLLVWWHHLARVSTPQLRRVQPPRAQTRLALTLDPTGNPTAVVAGAVQQIAVTIDTGSNRVEGVQWELAYDPTVITQVRVLPGPFFPQPFILINRVDPDHGRIDFADGIQPTTGHPMQGRGTVAILLVRVGNTPAGDAAHRKTQLAFLPNTEVVQVGTLGSVLQRAVGLTLPLQSGAPGVR